MKNYYMTDIPLHILNSLLHPKSMEDYTQGNLKNSNKRNSDCEWKSMSDMFLNLDTLHLNNLNK